MFSAWVGVVLLFAVFGLFALIIIGASPRGDTYEERRAKTRIEKLQTLRQESSKALTTYGWVDKSKGVVRIPIDEAMKLTVAELARKSPVPANPIATPETAPPAQSAGSPSAPGPGAVKAGVNPGSTPGKSPAAASQPAVSAVPAGSPSGTPKTAMPSSATPALSPTSTASGKTP